MEETNKLYCTQVITIVEPARDNAGKLVKWHRKCNRPANRIVLQGLLTTAEAVLCWQHQQAAERELVQQANGKKKEPDPRQVSLFG